MYYKTEHRKKYRKEDKKRRPESHENISQRRGGDERKVMVYSTCS